MFLSSDTEVKSVPSMYAENRNFDAVLATILPKLSPTSMFQDHASQRDALGEATDRRQGFKYKVRPSLHRASSGGRTASR
jgi:hypothetical protein